MKIRNYYLLAIGGALVGAATGFGWRYYVEAEKPPGPSAVAMVEQVDHLPAFRYPDLTGQQRDASEFDGKVLVVNFWATWCPPCRKETPTFVELQRDYAESVQFIGIAIDDEEPVREFAESFDVNYPVLLGDVDAVAMSRSLGNRYEGLPFTVVVGTDGKVILRHAGGLEREQLEPLLQRLIEAG